MIDERALIADILAKFEKYVLHLSYLPYCSDAPVSVRYQQGVNPIQFKLFYKIFCFTNIDNLLTESLEAAFLFEQVTYAVL